MAVAIRGTTPAEFTSGTATISGTLTGTRSPVAGDLLVMIHCNDFYLLSNMPTPTVGGSSTGVTAVTGATADGGSNLGHAKVWTYPVPTSGDLAVAVTETGTGDEEKALVVYVLSGADTTTQIDVSGNATYGTSASHALTNVSPTSSDGYLIAHDNSGGGVNVTSYTPPSGMTETYDLSVAAGMGTTGAIEQLVSSGAIGSLSFTPAGSANGVVSTLVVLTGSAAPALPPILVMPQRR